MFFHVYFLRYTCGPYAKFRSIDGTLYEEANITCQWNKQWNLTELDPCICKYSLQNFNYPYSKAHCKDKYFVCG